MLPQELQGALESLYGHYKRQYAAWESDQEGRENGRTPPVFIVVCNNTNVSKMVYDYVAGHETGHPHPDGAPVVAPGHFDIFSNVQAQRWLHRPNSILVDSEQLESDEGMSPDFKKLAAAQIEDFKAEYRQQLSRPGRRKRSTDEDLMREVLNTVGKPGKLGENVKCVVSVSMLTEGWDANTVTHILGVRAFGTQLLCEQVVGRGLRRMSYVLNDEGHFDPEYADVYGVPFSFIPCAGVPKEGEEKKPAQKPGRVRALPERLTERPWLEVTFPRVIGYRYEVPAERLKAVFDESSPSCCPPRTYPRAPRTHPSWAKTVVHTLDDLKGIRPQAVAFKLATHLQQHHFRGKVWLFPQLLAIVRDWLGDPDGDSPHVDYGDEAFPSLLPVQVQKANEAAEKIYKAIVSGTGGEKRAAGRVARVRPDGQHRLRLLRHREAGVEDRPREVSPELRPRGQLVGDAVRGEGRAHGRGALRQEPEPGLQDSLHVRGAARELLPRLPRAHRRRPRRRGPIEHDRRDFRAGAEAEGRRKSRQ